MRSEPTTHGAEHNEHDGHPVATDSPASARTHVPHLAVIRYGKAALVNALETGAVLREERSQRGEAFEAWVDKELGLSRDEADCYIRFYEESGLRPEQLTPDIDVKLPRVLGLLGQLSNALGKGAVPVRPTGTTDRAGRRQPKRTVSTDVGTTRPKQSPKPEEVTSRPAKASEGARAHTTKTTAKAKPGQQDRDGRQSALTAEQKQFLLRRSPKLFMQVRMGELSIEDALRIAKDMPVRRLPQQTQPR